MFVHAAKFGILATAMALSSQAFAFHDTGLPQDVAQAIAELTQAAQISCQGGYQQACGLAQEFQATGYQLGQAAQACQAGNQQACQVYYAGIQNVSAYYQQYQATQFAQQVPTQGNYSMDQHQFNMQQQQNWAAQQQQNWQQQQTLNDARHQQFIDYIRQ
jgi:hypothetical protein